MCYTFLVALSGVTALVVYETNAPTGLMSNKSSLRIKKKGATNNNTKKGRNSAAVDKQFPIISYNSKIVLPSWRCKSVFCYRHKR